MTGRRFRVVIDASNMTIHRDKFIRTGIQEVVYRTATAIAQVRDDFPEWEIITLPQLPRRFGNRLTHQSLLPYPNTSPEILAQIEDSLGLNSTEVWGFDLKSKNYHLDDSEIFSFFEGADRFHLQSMANIAPLCEKVGISKKGPIHGSFTLYDLVPILYPEYCDDRIARWYQNELMPGMVRHLEHAICISRHTALDAAQNPATQELGRITVLPLPFEFPVLSHSGPTTESESTLDRLGLIPYQYLIYLGSLEPRKNFEGLLDGFETYRRLNSASRLKLVLVGSTGWKNTFLDTRMLESPFQADILRSGYLQDSELDQVIGSATAMAMLSHYEGYGLPIAQAHSRGVPCITSLGSSLPEACGGNGIFADPQDPFSVSAAIRAAVRLREKGLVNRPDPALREWTWNNYAKNLLRSLL